MAGNGLASLPPEIVLDILGRIASHSLIDLMNCKQR